MFPVKESFLKASGPTGSNHVLVYFFVGGKNSEQQQKNVFKEFTSKEFLFSWSVVGLVEFCAAKRQAHA